jgi:Na+-transporting NADH:ubiquinone oxidoreductase subunit NqrD
MTSQEEAALVWTSFLGLSVALHAWTVLWKNVWAGSLKETMAFVGMAALVTTVDLLAQIYAYPVWRGLGLFFAVILANALCAVWKESLRVKMRLALWAALPMLSVGYAKRALPAHFEPGEPAWIFFALAFFLFVVGALARKKWVLL